MRTLKETTSLKHQQAGSYIYTIVPVPTSSKSSSFIYIASDDSITHIDTKLNVLDTLPSAHEGISCLVQVPNADSKTFATAGRDGKVRVWTAESNGQIMKKPLLEVRTRKCCSLRRPCVNANSSSERTSRLCNSYQLGGESVSCWH
jgi:WD40 repeat protein